MARQDEFTMTLGLGNAAFDGPEDRRSEIARILRKTADRVEQYLDAHGKAFDLNGNHVGDWAFDPHADEDEPEEHEE